MSAKTIACSNCQHVWTYEPPLARRAECPNCHVDAHVCVNCRYFDPSAHHECRESQASWVKEKDRSNFCSYFEPGVGGGRRTQDLANKAQLEALFGGPKAEAAAPAPGASLAEQLAKFLEGKK